jgi:ribosome biogenesis GTPase A
MAIQWFPGHMHKARKEIAEVMPQMDFIIEVLDARIPFSSENPLVDSLRKNKPCIKLLNKSDLADPAMTQIWLDYFNQQEGVSARTTTTEQPQSIRKIIAESEQMFAKKIAEGKVVRAMIMGIPNVGKSSIINILAGKVIAKVGNEPAVTQRQQKIKLTDQLMLSDTPGFLWPKLEPENSGYRLAVTGAVKNTAMEYDDVATFAAEYLLSAYPDRLIERYQLENLPASDFALVEEVGRTRGFLQKGGRVNYHKASEVLLNELRAGTLGGLTLETPEMIKAELAELAILKEQKKAEKEARKQRFKQKR